ncbi:transcription factor IIIC subunit delta N-term-domain-containing protein, partial [Schizophyllum fasciatum]
MTGPPVYTALHVPTVTAYPSVRCIGWTSDGQLCFLSRGAVYIMTPEQGITFDTSSLLKSSTTKSISDRAIGWFRTVIPIDKTIAYQWPEHSQDWSVGTLGAIDVSVWSIASSPTGLSPENGCILVTLTSNMDLTMWSGGKNAFKGEWYKLVEVTPRLLTFAENEPIIQRTLRAQITCIAWSESTDFGISPAPPLDASLLVLGCRAGSLALLRYLDKDVELVSSIKVSDVWVIDVAITPLICRGDAMLTPHPIAGEAQIAFALSDGSIGLLKVTQRLESTGAEEPFAYNHRLVTETDADPQTAFRADGRRTTALAWVTFDQRSVTCLGGLQTGSHLVILDRPNRIGLAALARSQNTPAADAHNATTLEFPDDNDFPDDVEMADATGLSGAPAIGPGNAVVPTPPSKTPADDDEGRAFSSLTRQVFAKIENTRITRADVNRISGLASYDGAGVIVWAYESARPADFNYKHDAKNGSTLVVSTLWDDADDESFLEVISTTIHDCHVSSGCAPLHLLRPILFHLQDLAALDRLRTRVLEILRAGIETSPVPAFPSPFSAPHSQTASLPPVLFPTDDPSPSLAAYTGPLSPQLRQNLRSSIARHLFGSDALLGLRLRLAIADFMWKASAQEADRAACGAVAQAVLDAISHRVQSTVIRHIAAVTGCLTAADLPFALRLTVQATLPGAPPTLRALGSELLATLQRHLPGDALVPSSAAPGAAAACPACGAGVPLEGITTAVCPAGHTWARCSVTTFILSTPHVRTCVGCSRKALLPVSS